MPFTLISKCKWFPDDIPVEPTAPITWPCDTVCPVFTYKLLQCPYNMLTELVDFIITQYPYPEYPFPFAPNPAKVTVPDAAAFIAVPFGAAMSNPLWLSLDLIPNLELIVPDTGLTKDIPKLVGTLGPVYVAFGIVLVCATTTFFSLYNSETQVSTVLYSACSVEYFSTIPSFSAFVLFLSFNWFTADSASANVFTYAFSSSSSVIA